MPAGTQYAKELNKDSAGIKTPAFYDANLDEWLMGAANVVKTESGVFVFQKCTDDGRAKVDAQLSGRTAVKTATLVDSGGGVYNLSGEVDFDGYQYFTIYVPATWTGTAITLQTSPASGGTFSDVYNDAGIEVSLTVAASRAVTIDVNALNLASLRYVKFRSGTSASPTDESSAKVLTISCKS